MSSKIRPIRLGLVFALPAETAEGFGALRVASCGGLNLPWKSVVFYSHELYKPLEQYVASCSAGIFKTW